MGLELHCSSHIVHAWTCHCLCFLKPLMDGIHLAWGFGFGMVLLRNVSCYGDHTCCQLLSYFDLGDRLPELGV